MDQVPKEPVVLYRTLDRSTKDEIKIAEKYFRVTDSRVHLENKLVIARYCALPFYKELETDLHYQNSELLNSYHEHNYIADFNYYYDLIEHTPKTWFNDMRYVPKDAGPFVLKGKTNSRKFQWDTKMYAEDFPAATKLMCELLQDPLVENQGIIIRKFEKLKTYEIGLNGLPFTNEWRFFFYKKTLLSYGYYWSIAENKGEFSDEAMHLAQKIANTVSFHTNFFVLDLAQKETGEWILIEMNDGQMSGLSDNEPDVLYSNLKKALTGVPSERLHD